MNEITYEALLHDVVNLGEANHRDIDSAILKCFPCYFRRVARLALGGIEVGLRYELAGRCDTHRRDEVINSGRSEPRSALPNALIARPSFLLLSSNFAISLLKAQ